MDESDREPDRRITVVIIDDHPAIIAAVRMWCASATTPSIEVVDASPTPAVSWTGPGRSADVIVMGLHLGDARHALGNLRLLANAGRQVIVYSMLDGRDVAHAFLELGAVAYLAKTEGQAHLVAAVQAAGRRPHPVPVPVPVPRGLPSSRARATGPRLSNREEQILIEWFGCESKQVVADKLGLSLSTVSTCIDRIRVKYARVGRPAPTKAALVARAIQDGLVRIDDL